MVFTTYVPKTWKDLQNAVADYLSVAGYNTITPCTIETARGNVEVDVFIEASHELVKHIICECKLWNTRIPKEKVHAFRTVVHDCGADIGIIISKNGYQAGAIEAAKYSNVRLETWGSFTTIIADKWIKNMLLKTQLKAARVYSYLDTYDYEAERLSETEYKEFLNIREKTFSLVQNILLLNKDDFQNNPLLLEKLQYDHEYKDIETCLRDILNLMQESLTVLEQLSVQPNRPNRFMSTIRLNTILDYE